MPRCIGTYFNPGVTKALRQQNNKGTIRCSLCCRPAAAQCADGKYYCKYHMRKRFGFVAGVP